MATSNSAIKITELPNIGNNIAASTLIPVVNMAGVPITQKANLQITGNLILAGAGGAQFVPAAVANLAYTVVNSYQPNITRIGNLNINTFKVTGGVNGQYLQTDGTGNLSFVSGGGSGNGVVGGANTQIQFNNTGNFGGSTGLTWNSSTGVLSTLKFSVSSDATIYGDTALTNLNVAGNFTTNNIYTDNYYYANGDPFGGISGITVKDEGTNVVASANTINFVGAGVTTSNVGGVATITINGGNGNADTGNVTFDDINIIGTGNLHLQPDPANANSGSYLDIFLSSGPDLHLVASAAANLILGKDDGPNVMTSWNGNVYVQSWSSNTGNVGGIWTFDGDGNLTLPNDANIATIGNVTQFNTCTNGFLSLNSYDAGGNNIASLAVNSIDGLVGISTYDTATDSDYQWGFNITGGTIFPTLTVDLHNGGTQTGQTLQFGDPAQQVFITGPTPAVDTNAQRLIIQGQRGSGTGEGGDVYIWGGDSDVNGGDIKIYAGDADTTGRGGNIHVAGGRGTADGGEITLTGGQNDNGVGAYVGLTGGRGTSAGGAVNLNGGFGEATGGDINIIGGIGGNGLGSYGNVGISAGASSWAFDNTGNLTLPTNTFAVNYANGTQVSISGSGNTGNVTFDDNIVIGTGDEYGGAGLFLATGPNGVANLQYLQVRGGDFPTHIHLDTGNNAFYDQYFGADSRYVKLEANGNVVINADDYAGNGATWTLDTTGNLSLPAGGSIYSEGFTPSGNPGNTITLNPHGSGSITNQKLLVYPTAGDGDHIHLTSGNLYQTELFLGNDNFFVRLANTGNIIINSDDDAGNTAQWKFGIDGNLTASGNLIIAGNTNVFGTVSALIQPTDDKPLLAISSGANGAVSSVWVEDIGNVGTSNIAAVYANPIPGSGIVRIAVGQNGGNAGPNLWDFNANGTITLPASSGQIGISGYTNGIDLYNNNGGSGYVRMNYADESFVWADVGGAHVQTTGGTWDFDTDGNLTAPGNISATGNITAGNIITGTGTTGNITGANVISANTFQSTVVAFNQLPSASTPGLRAFINNGNLVAVGNFGVQVGGGGANYVPVWSDGANWCIG